MRMPNPRRAQLFVLGAPVAAAAIFVAAIWYRQMTPALPVAAIPSGPTPAVTDGFTWIPAGTTYSHVVSPSTNPSKHQATQVDEFHLARHEVTNAEFSRFVLATGYLTTAQQTGEGYVFLPSEGDWVATRGADWRHPQGPESSIAGKEDHPVVQVSLYDARAYARWAGHRLPNECEWQHAVRRGGESVPSGNTFQGWFPRQNTVEDGYRGTAPVGSYEANSYGARDMIGNVREWCDDNEKIAGAKNDRTLAVLRGGDWLTYDRSELLFNLRDKVRADWRDDTTGFRCVRVR